MYPSQIAITVCWLLLACLCQAQPSLGIPEPGLLLFGSVTNVGGGLPLPPPAVTWQISSGLDLVTVPATVVVVNGQFFHLARVPFETRSVGSTNFGQTPNVLALTATPSTYTRSAWMGTNSCTFLIPSQATLSFSTADRGTTERVDLAVNILTPNLDSDGDGMPDWAELIAGTDPHDPNSVLKLSTGVIPSPQGGLIIQWPSIPGRVYAVYSSTNLAAGFSPRSINIIATATTTTYRDSSATGLGPFFYRIQVNTNSTP